MKDPLPADLLRQRGDVSADFVFALANALQTTVRAPTGFVFVAPEEDPFIEDGAGWQEATPGMAAAPEPIDPLWRSIGRTDRLLLREHDRFVAYPLRSVIRLDVITAAGETLGAFINWVPPRLDAAFQFMNLAQPRRERGTPASVQTGKVVVTIGERRRIFTVHNDLLLEDALAPETYYDVRFRELVGFMKRGFSSRI